MLFVLQTKKMTMKYNLEMVKIVSKSGIAFEMATAITEMNVVLSKYSTEILLDDTEQAVRIRRKKAGK